MNDITELREQDLRILHSMWGWHIHFCLYGYKNNYHTSVDGRKMKRLLKAGLVEREPFFDSWSYRLTEAGVALAKELCPPHIEKKPHHRNIDCSHLCVSIDIARRNNADELYPDCDTDSYHRMRRVLDVAQGQINSILTYRKN
jgi:hypothetical protein